MNILNLPAWSVLDTREADHDYHITVQLSYPPRRDGGAFPRKPRRCAGLLLCPSEKSTMPAKPPERPQDAPILCRARDVAQGAESRGVGRGGSQSGSQVQPS